MSLCIGFAPLQAGQVVQVLHGDVYHPQRLVQRRAEHHAAALQHITGQLDERASGGGLAAQLAVAAPHGEARRLGSRLALLQNGQMCAVPALHTAVRYLGIQKALPIRLHADRPLGAAVAARGAAGAAVEGANWGAVCSVISPPPVPVSFLRLLYHKSEKSTTLTNTVRFSGHNSWYTGHSEGKKPHITI